MKRLTIEFYKKEQCPLFRHGNCMGMEVYCFRPTSPCGFPNHCPAEDIGDE
jgi:hypothetical protein